MADEKSGAKKSPATTFGGVVGALGALVFALGEALGKESVKAIGVLITGLGTALIGMNARDHNVTSEQAGLK
jgi:hypothetical protein